MTQLLTCGVTVCEQFMRSVLVDGYDLWFLFEDLFSSWKFITRAFLKGYSAQDAKHTDFCESGLWFSNWAFKTQSETRTQIIIWGTKLSPFLWFGRCVKDATGGGGRLCPIQLASCSEMFLELVVQSVTINRASRICHGSASTLKRGFQGLPGPTSSFLILWDCHSNYNDDKLTYAAFKDSVLHLRRCCSSWLL